MTKAQRLAVKGYRKGIQKLLKESPVPEINKKGELRLKTEPQIKFLERMIRNCEWEPLFGHLTKDGPNSRSQTYWVMLRRK